MSDSFVHLHVHTEYSMLDGAAKVAPLFAEAKRLEMPAIAMTDHGNMYGAAEFYREAEKTGIKPIVGIEAYVAPASRFHKKPVFWGQNHQRDTNELGEGGDVSGAGAYTHMTMLAANATGLRNLFRLSSLASFDGYYRKPRMDRELIADHAEGIIATTGCPSGEVQTRLRLRQMDKALQAASDYRDIFGQDNFFVELMDHGLAIERSVREGLLDISRKLNLRPLPTNDSHYVVPGQAEMHEALLCVQSGKTLSDPNRFKLEGGGYYIKPAAEMRDYWDTELPGAADNTLWIAERVESYAEVFANVDRMPRFPVPEGETEETLLRKQIEAGAKQLFPQGLPEGYTERIDYEYSVIVKKGFPGYFLVVADIVRHAREIGVWVAPGRGSAAGSLVAYLVGITEVDPIPFGLLFERFLNPERPSAPDIDLDLEDRRRGEVIAYAVQQYGADKVAQVITFGTIKTKAALKDAARVIHGQAGFAIADRISKALPPAVMAKDIPLSGIVDPKHPRYAEAAEIRSLIETDAEAGKIFETARGLEGLIRNAGVHACAVIMSSQPLMESVPLWKRDDGSIITGWDYPACEAVGLLKMDLLGIRNLTVLGDAQENVRKAGGAELKLKSLSLDDPTTYKLLCRGDTLGVFQLDGGPLQDLLRRMQPTGFDDIAATLALYRPGPMGANAHNDYADRKNKRKKITPIHPELAEALKDILAETYGLIVYQEQIMFIAQKVAGYSMAEADVLRKAMGKKKKDVLEKEFEHFHGGMRSNGFSDEAVKVLWNTIVPFADYAFNKSHAAAYGMIAYWTAYLKANYPAEYMAALLTSVGDNKDKSALYLGECRRLGIKVLAPDINDSVHAFTAINGDIRFGLGAIRNVGANVVQSIIETREKKGRYTSFTDFLEKVELVCCNKRTVESLIKAGAFDSFGLTRRALLQIHEEAVDAVVGLKRHEARGQFDLFGSADDGDRLEDSSPLAHLVFIPDEWPRAQLLAFEREMLGLYVSAHPLDGAERVLRKHAPKPIAVVLDDAPKEGEIVLSGMISAIDRRVNKNGEPWAIVTLEDLDASIEILFFPKSYSVLHEDLIPDTAIAVKGRVNWREDKMAIFGSGVISLDISDVDTTPLPVINSANEVSGSTPSKSTTRPFSMRADAIALTSDAVRELRSALSAHRGDTPVQILVCHQGRETHLAVDKYSVNASAALIGELKAIRGITVSN